MSKRFKTPSGKTYRTVSDDEKLDLNTSGETPNFVAVSKADAARFGHAQAVDNVENTNAFTKAHRRAQQVKADFGPQGPERVAYPTKLSQQTLLGEHPQFAPVMRRAKAFVMDLPTLNAVKELGAQPEETWLKDVVLPFDVTHVTLGIVRVAMEDREGVYIRRTGGLVVNGHIFPTWDDGHRASIYPARIALPGHAGAGWVKDLHGLVNPEWVDQDKGWKESIDLWKNDAVTLPPGMRLDGNYTVGRLWLETAGYEDLQGKDAGAATIAALRGVCHHVAAFLAYINRERLRIEYERQPGQDGRTVIRGRSVPRYTPGIVRLKPEAPVKINTATPDPDREARHIAGRETRRHWVTSDVKHNDEWQAYQTGDGRTRYRRPREGHKIGDVNKTYVVGGVQEVEVRFTAKDFGDAVPTVDPTPYASAGPRPPRVKCPHCSWTFINQQAADQHIGYHHGGIIVQTQQT